MSWKCPECGLENTDGTRACDGCGVIRWGKLVLTSETTHLEITIGVDTVVGKRLLCSFAGDEAVYASEPQFAVQRDAPRRGWTISHDVRAKNPTYLNGSALASPMLLADGNVVSIGPEKMRLRVRLQD